MNKQHDFDNLFTVTSLFPCAFLERELLRKEITQNHTTANHCNDKENSTHMVNPSDKVAFCLQMMNTSMKRRKCLGFFFFPPTNDIQELVLFFDSGLPTLPGSPLSARALSTPWLPSIPGLFLCGRQHPASGCLTVA